ncbi:glycoside hydrolase family 32 protein [Jidongwangia harbinensis]|uniref:glycoside hydrolase family 32 protein n=1 Tax=Jidongwangia harbinensis TaxID=2878561 RepID=UPI001CD94957|nr:glycoside hydrolase family 32 protein [Jidongwangia harbinensis]MCA2211824.1 glycoside hydrolase family 32 protein [Jidongwangia harbinensis]
MTKHPRVATVLILLLSAVVVAVTGRAAGAGTPAGYPEFPYPPTGYDEPHRGQFHFSSRAGWLNDPNGSFWYRGVYHLFYQHNPHGLAWDTMHWGHATSTDLVHWTQKPVALEPGVHAGDLWSGNGVVDTANVSGLKTGADDPILVFSGTNGATVHYSTDGARTFRSYAGGRKVAVPAGTSRDPKVFWHAPTRRWVMVLWSDGGGNGADFYTSPDLLTWTHRSRFAADWFFECPDMFELPVDGDPARRTWVLTDAGGEYVLGDFDGATFTPRSAVHRTDHGANHPGGTFYAAQTFLGDPHGRVVQTAWQPGNRGTTWTGNLTFPAELGLRTFAEGVRLTRNPVAEISSLYGAGATFANRTVSPSDPLRPGTGDTYQITAEFDTTTATAARFGLKLHTRADGTYDRAVTYDTAAHTLYGAPLPPVDGRVRMRVLVDRGQLEVFGADGKLSVSDNVAFDSSPGSQGIEVFAEGGSVRLVSLRLDRLRTAWGTGEPTLDTNLGGTFTDAGGAWTDVTDGKQGQATGDAFYLNSATGASFTYSGDLRIDRGDAAGLTFRASADGSRHYTATLDTGGVVKLWRPGRVIASHATPITPGHTHHLEVRAEGSRLRVYLDHATTPVIDATDTTYASGRFGANVFHGTAVIDNLTVNATGLTTNLAGPWRPVGGTWTAPGTGVHARGPGDTFYLSTTSGTDFTYAGDVTALNGVAAALTFRANADATRHYTANIDTTGVVKLWRPGRDIATYPTPIVPGRPYRLQVVARGPDLRVHLDGAEVIRATDDAYPSGLFGLNAYAGTATFQNVTVQ